MVLAHFALVLNKGSGVSCGDKGRVRTRVQRKHSYIWGKRKTWNWIRLNKSDCPHSTIWKLQVQGFLINLSRFYEWDYMFGQQQMYHLYGGKRYRRRSKKEAWQFQASESDLCNMQQLWPLQEDRLQNKKKKKSFLSKRARKLERTLSHREG